MADHAASLALNGGEAARATILIVDDDPLIRGQLEGIFRSQGHGVEAAADVEEALAKLARGPFTLAFVDLKMPGRDGISLTRDIRERWPGTDVIMITGHASIRGAVEAMRQGACDYITKPFEPDEIVLATRRALDRRRLLDEIQYLRRQLSDRHRFANMVSRDPAMLEVFAAIETLADTDLTVVITGESGTGKELVARAMHFEGPRRAGRFVAVNCAALPENLLESELFGYDRGAFTGALQDRVGKIELANGGTLFLDEVESIPLSMQAKLLRVLEERTIERLGSNRRIAVDMRVLAATNEDLERCVAEGRMREDFFYRINVVPIHLPPLRQRTEDIPLIAAEFLQNNKLARDKGIDRIAEPALARLMAYRWPGNIRELLNVLQRAILRAREGVILEVDLPGAAAAAPIVGTNDSVGLPLREFLREAEERYLRGLLGQFGGNILAAARHAGIDQATLHRKMKLHGVAASAFREAARARRRPEVG